MVAGTAPSDVNELIPLGIVPTPFTRERQRMYPAGDMLRWRILATAIQLGHPFHTQQGNCPAIFSRLKEFSSITPYWRIQ